MEIIAKDIVKTFKGRQVVKGLTFTIKKGDCFGLIGPNGAGKTTTIECLLGIKKLDRGETLIFGQDPRQQRKKIFEKVGVQLQASSYQNTIRVNEICQEISALYQKPRNYHELLTLFHLDHLQKQPVADLSGGEKQKLSLVLALLPDPEIIFLDELTTGLDTEARYEVWQILKHLKATGLTIFLTTHYMEEAEFLCDQLYLIKNGEKIVTGTVAQIIKQSHQKNLEAAYLHFMEEAHHD